MLYRVAGERESDDIHSGSWAVCHSHARIIWKCDEDRLRSCLTLDTASKRDAALIALLLRTGFRARSVFEIVTNTHCRIGKDFVELLVQDIKTQLRMEYKAIL